MTLAPTLTLSLSATLALTLTPPLTLALCPPPNQVLSDEELDEHERAQLLLENETLQKELDCLAEQARYPYPYPYPYP